MTRKTILAGLALVLLLGGVLAVTRVNAQILLDPVAVRAAAVGAGLGSLRNVPVPQVNNIGDFLNAGPGAKSMAIVLGKSLFWDIQVGSDGIACASCHFQAGADVRSKNQLNPGLKAGDNTFGNSTIPGVPGWSQFQPNYQITANDFPFHQLADSQREDYNHRVMTHDSNDVASSSGVFNAVFTGIVSGNATDSGTAVADQVYKVGDVNVRRVEPRNTPSVINAVYNVDNFWDGRARNQFNGINPFGPLDENASILISSSGNLSEVKVSMRNSSLASQAVGPPLSDLEMSFAGRTFPDVGKKLLASRPLAFQRVHADDSALSVYSRAGQNLDGLTFTTYTEMVQTVFQSKYWDSDKVITFNPNGSRVINPPGTSGGYTQMEANFSLFFGLAIQAYESTLVSDRSRFDQFMEGDNEAFTQDELAGLLTFINKGTAAQKADPLFTGISQGSCTSCHGGALLSDATFPGMGIEGPIEVDLAPVMLDGAVKIGSELFLVDNGFYNIGIRPTSEDLGRGESILGKPLSASRQALQGLPFAPPLPPNLPPGIRVASDGTFKVPILRNVELTGPYFHTGSYETLREIIDFYHRHGDFADINIANLDGPMANVKLDARVNPAGKDLDTDQLISFLITLTDDRVRTEKAPFDHPAIPIPDGHPGDTTAVNQFTIVNGVKVAADTMLQIPAIGRNGREASSLEPLEPFLGGTALQASLIRLRPGWNTMSVPVRLNSTMDTWGEFRTVAGLGTPTAYYWNGTTFQVVADAYVLTPLEAIFVQATVPSTIQIVPFSGVSAPPSKTLGAGWNLVGAGFLESQMPVKDALVSIETIPTVTAINGYTNVVSPNINALGWTYIRGSALIPNMFMGEGYWVFMSAPGQVSGFTSTPIQLR